MQLTDDALLTVIGERLAALGLARKLTQQRLAQEAGLGLRTVQRLELGLAATQLSGFVRACHLLGLIERFDLLIPEIALSPMQQLKSQGRKRQRATRKRPPSTSPIATTRLAPGPRCTRRL